jgi:hypothetical protein
VGVLLPQREEDLDLVEQNLGGVDAAYITPGIAALAPEERGDWWGWLGTRGIYRGMVPVGTTPPGWLLRVRESEGNR